MPNEKWKNLATGEEWEKDTSGRWIVSKKAQEQLKEFIQRPSSIDISPEAEVLPEKPLSYEAIQYLPTITSIIGSLAGLKWNYWKCSYYWCWCCLWKCVKESNS